MSAYLGALPQWFFLNVILALIPVFFSLVLVWILDLDTTWFRVLRGGELYVFSTTIAAASISTRVLEGRPIGDTVLVTGLALGLVMLFSVCLFAVAALMQIQQHNVSDRSSLRISGTSLACAFLAATLSYIISL